MTYPETIQSSEPQSNPEWFKRQSLAALRGSLECGHYPGYPTERLWGSGASTTEVFDLPAGPWQMGAETEVPTPDQQAKLRSTGLDLDAAGRPLHPWLGQMLSDPTIGVITGKGFYWDWGPNYTADPIIIRHDLSQPHMLLIKRGDTGHWALPGGFINKNESDVDAAIREGAEETGVHVNQLAHTVKPIYKGPLADLRVTAHAWPETTAFCFDLALDSGQELKLLTEMMSANRRQYMARSLGRLAFKEQTARLPWKGSDDAVQAKWVPASEIGDKLFGSHRLLIEMALNN